MPAGFLTIQQVRELDLGHGEKPDYFNCKSTITFCKKDNCLYKVRERERERGGGGGGAETAPCCV